MNRPVSLADDKLDEDKLIDVARGMRSHYVASGQLPDRQCAICCGSFNPLHVAHVELLKLAEKKSGLPGVFELSVTNVDKPPLNLPEMRRRRAQFEAPGHTLVLTNQPRYLGKLSIFPAGSCFVMGADTYIRLVDSRYYNPLESPLSVFENSGTKFVVAPRRFADGKIITGQAVLSASANADRWASISLFVSSQEFLMDISSTQLRGEASAVLVQPRGNR